MKTFVKIGETTHEVELTERLGELIVHLDGEPCEVRQRPSYPFFSGVFYPKI